MAYRPRKEGTRTCEDNPEDDHHCEEHSAQTDHLRGGSDREEADGGHGVDHAVSNKELRRPTAKTTVEVSSFIIIGKNRWRSSLSC